MAEDNHVLAYDVAEGEDGSPRPAASPYEEALDALSSLITKRTRADKSNKGDRFDLLFDYIKILDLEDPISKMKFIHVAGTKGKGSTCTFAESILRNCGFHTGLFSSPHLIDFRERFQLDGVDICEEKFLAYFWWCWARLKENASDDLPMPTYFRFLALLAFKIFAAEQVDVAILEVGLGGKFDATNVVQKPIVCGISSLGYDHMEILGNTLGEIAGEKAGIFKHGVPVLTVPQPDEAMCVLKEKASQLDVQLQIASPLDMNLLSGLHLGLDGEHQYLNAGLAVALCSTWLQRTSHIEVNYLDPTSSLREQFLKGLTTATLQGRAQIVSDRLIDVESPGGLVFYLDGAHSPESMEVCAKWFCSAIREENQQHSLGNVWHDTYSVSHDTVDNYYRETPWQYSTQILLFNCMSVRDPQLLLPRLGATCANNGVHFKKALFVPNIFVYNKVSSGALPATIETQVDLSWQLTLQKVWENIISSEKGGDARNLDFICEDDNKKYVENCENSIVFASLPLAMKWLQDTVRQNKSVRFQGLLRLVEGSDQVAIQKLSSWVHGGRSSIAFAHNYFRTERPRKAWAADVWASCIPPKHAFTMWLTPSFLVRIRSFSWALIRGVRFVGIWVNPASTCSSSALLVLLSGGMLKIRWVFLE